MRSECKTIVVFSWVGGGRQQVVEHLVGLLVVVSEAIISNFIMQSLWRFEND